MSYLQAIFAFIQNVCDEDDEFKKMCQEIEEINRENLKLERDIEECDRDYVRLQIEQHKLQIYAANRMDEKTIEHCDRTSMGIFQQALDLKGLLKTIDFGQIVKCRHMEMEAKFLKDSQPIQEAMATSQEWYEKMEQRHIVRQYRQTQVANRVAEEEARQELLAMEISDKDSWEKLSQAKGKRNELIVALIQEGKEMEAWKEKLVKLNKYESYIEGLRQEKLMLLKQLEEKQLKAFNPNLSSSSTNSNSNKIGPKYTPNINKTPEFATPTLPSLEEILKIFNQTEIKTSTSKKSILHNTSYDDPPSAAKQNKNVSFKFPLEEFHEYPQQEMETEIELETETETEIEIEDLKQQIVKEINVESVENLQKDTEIETIDLLTPVEKEAPQKIEILQRSEKSVADKPQQPLIEIQECIVFKTPFPIQQVNTISDKLNVSDITLNSSKHSGNTSLSRSSNNKVSVLDNTSSSSKHAKSPLDSLSANEQNTKDVLNTTRIISSNELTSSSAEISPRTSTKSSSKQSYLKDDFEAFFKDNDDQFWSSRDSANETPKAGDGNNDAADFLDFGHSKGGFTFDSDDNTGDNLGIMDFM